MADNKFRNARRRVVIDVDPVEGFTPGSAARESERGAGEHGRAAQQGYGVEYGDESFWTKVAGFAHKAGYEVIEKALVLYYCLQDGDTPAWAKAVIVSALGYFIVPADVIPDFVPGAGFADDLGTILLALAAVLTHVKPAHRQRAEERIGEWFGDA